MFSVFGALVHVALYGLAIAIWRNGDGIERACAAVIIVGSLALLALDVV